MPFLRRLALLALLAVSTSGDTGATPAAARPGSTAAGEAKDPAAGLIPPERRTLWRPGIPGGVPNVTKVCRTIDAARYGNGGRDATATIQEAIDACPEGEAVYLPPGAYSTTDVLRIGKGIVLRGAGPAATQIHRHGARADFGGSVIRIYTDASYDRPTRITRLARKGDTEVRVADGSPFSRGEIVQVDQRDDPKRVVTGGCRWFKRIDGDGGARSVGQRVEISDVKGDVLRLASPLHADYDPAFRAEVVRSEVDPVRGAGIEDLYVTGGNGANLYVASAAYTWVRNVESDRVQGRHIALAGCYRCVVRDSYVHHALSYASGANAYGISLSTQTSDTLVENNIAYYLNKPIVLEASGGGNVIAYNYADDPILGQTPGWQEVALDGSHCSHPHMTLFEGNWAPHMGAAATHGSAGQLTFFRNHASSRARTLVHTSNTEAVQLDAGMYEMNVVGNVLSAPGIGAIYEPIPDPKRHDVYQWRTLTWPPPKVYLLGGWARGDSPENFDPRVAKTLLRHGNFDHVSGEVRWDPAVARRDLPPSLYLAGKPAFFGDLPWPWVDPTGDEKVGRLPAKERFEALQGTFERR